MSAIKISKTKDNFVKDDRKFFYMADTVWSAFANIDFEDWEYYLDYRRFQGFNAIQMTVQPQWDGSESDINIKPFKVDSNGKYDFYSINDEYFTRAKTMLEMATKKGFTPALVVLWANSVKDTWAGKRLPDLVMPYDTIKPYCEYVGKAFSKYDPIYIISGDTNIESDETIKYYLTALETIKSVSPESLTTMHLCQAYDAYLPDDFINSKYFDFYMFESGHVIDRQHLTYEFSKRFHDLPIKRPVVNGEPCYDGMGYCVKYADEQNADIGSYGRFTNFDLRKAYWRSLLSGAKAGLAYGAHGIWGWHKKGKKFPGEVFCGTPYDWPTALKLEGAWDATFTKWVFEKFDLFDIEPIEKILNETKEIRMSASNDLKKVAIYIPYNADVEVDMDLVGYDWTLINLSDKRFAKPEIKVNKNSSVIKMHYFDSDVLVVGIK